MYVTLADRIAEHIDLYLYDIIKMSIALYTFIISVISYTNSYVYLLSFNC